MVQVDVMSRVEFEKIPQTNNNIRSLGSLVFDKRNELGDRAHLGKVRISHMAREHLLVTH